MSVYSDYKVGALNDEEYRFVNHREALRYNEEVSYDNIYDEEDDDDD